MHEECMQQCLSANNKCPVCRKSISGGGDHDTSASGLADGQDNVMGGHWKCVGCTFENPDRARTCSASGVSKATAQMADTLRAQMACPCCCHLPLHPPRRPRDHRRAEAVAGIPLHARYPGPRDPPPTSSRSLKEPGES
jgi:hypothetical protein